MAPQLTALALGALLAGCAASGQELAAAGAGPSEEGLAERRLTTIDDSQRHASAHLRYQQPHEVQDAVQSWYMTLVPKHSSEDTYFAVLGQHLGYFGLQQVEKWGLFFQGKVVFSIWDKGCNEIMDPSACPESQRAELIECGRHSICTTFGGEGTGMKSYMHFREWSTEEAYGFLIQSFDEGNGKARQEGYFHAPELGGWVLLAKLRVNVGATGWTMRDQFSFVEQWSTRSGEDVRFARFGESFMERAGAAPDAFHWTPWTPGTHATFSHTDGPNEVATHVDGNVTDGGAMWGLGIGGMLQNTIPDGHALSLTVTPTMPNALYHWLQMRMDQQLPGGCLGDTCLDTKILAWLYSAITLEYLPISCICLLIVIIGVVACIYRFVVPRLLGKSESRGLQQAAPLVPPAGQPQMRYGYELPRYGYEQPQYQYRR